MKIQFLFLISLVFTNFIRAQKDKFQIQITADDKESIHGFSFWNEIKVVSKDTSFYYSLHSYTPDTVTITKKGIYTVSCKSVFNHSISKSVEIKKKGKTKIKLQGMRDFYKHAPEAINLTERVKNMDTLIIICSTGNPAISYSKIGIVKKDGKYIAMQFKGLTDDIFQVMQISDLQYAEVIKFEAIGKKLKPNPSCETPETYTIELNREIFSFVDTSCQWHGFDVLKAVLFILER
jgi:hypothetical protein